MKNALVLGALFGIGIVIGSFTNNGSVFITDAVAGTAIESQARASSGLNQPTYERMSVSNRDQQLHDWAHGHVSRTLESEQTVVKTTDLDY